MDNEQAPIGQGVFVCLESDSLSHARRDTEPPDDLPSLIVKALTLVIISAIIGRETILLVFEVIVLAWAINRLESHNDDLDRRAAGRQARMDDAWKKHLELLSEIVEVSKRNLSQVGTNEVDTEAREDDSGESPQVVAEAEVVSGECLNSVEDAGRESKEERTKEEDEAKSNEESDAEYIGSDKEAKTDGESEVEANRESAKYRDHRGEEVRKEVRAARPNTAERATAERDRTRRLQREEEDRQRSAEVTTDLPFPLMLNNPCSTCIGTTQKHARCQNSFITEFRKTQALLRIEIMKSTNPGNIFEWLPLKELADWLLCPRWHRDKIPQGKEIADHWYAELKPARDALAGRQTGRNQNSAALPRTSFGFGTSFGSPSSVLPSPGRDIFTPTRTPLSEFGTPQSSVPPSSVRPSPSSRSQVRSSGFGNPAVNLRPTFAALAAEAR